MLLIADLLRKNIKIGIVTAAGYTTADRYYERLHGLLDAIAGSADLDDAQKQSVVIMGGEANYLFAMDLDSPHRLSPVPRARWLTPEMAAWSEADIAALLDVAESALRDCVRTMNLPATLVRKDRAVGIVPTDPSVRIARESLEETVLVVQRILELSSLGVPASAAPGTRSAGVPFCAFNGGRDVFVDIGDKSWGVSGVPEVVLLRCAGTADPRREHAARRRPVPQRRLQRLQGAQRGHHGVDREPGRDGRAARRAGGPDAEEAVVAWVRVHECMSERMSDLVRWQGG